MATPEYLICVECETPCYEFEYKGDQLVEVICPACGNDDPEQFLTEEQFEALI